MKTVIILLFLFCSINVIGQGNFFWSHSNIVESLGAEVQVGVIADWTGIGMSSTGQLQVACALEREIYRSTDFGVTWSDMNNGAKDYGDIAVSGDGSTILVCERSGPLHRYTSYWSQLPLSNSSFRDVAISYTGQYMIVTTTDKAYVSNDYGASWTLKFNNDVLLSDCTMNSTGQYMVICSSREPSNTGAVGSGRIYVSSNYGETWTPMLQQDSWSDLTISENGNYINAVSSSGYFSHFQNSYTGYITIRSTEVLISANLRGVDSSGDGAYSIIAGAMTSFYSTSDKGITIKDLSNTSRNWNDIAISNSGDKKTAVVFGGYIYTFNR